MSPIGRFLLRNCDNNLRIDLHDRRIAGLMQEAGFKYLRVKTVALFLGVTLVGGS